MLLQAQSINGLCLDSTHYKNSNALYASHQQHKTAITFGETFLAEVAPFDLCNVAKLSIEKYNLVFTTVANCRLQNHIIEQEIPTQVLGYTLFEQTCFHRQPRNNLKHVNIMLNSFKIKFTIVYILYQFVPNRVGSTPPVTPSSVRRFDVKLQVINIFVQSEC